MPTKVKLIISLIVLVLAALTGAYESWHGIDQGAWAVVFLGVFMVFSIWIFPDVNREDPEGPASSSAR